MDVLFEYDEQVVDGVVDFFDREFPTTVWFPGDDGTWELCVLTCVDGVRYFDYADSGYDPDETVTLTIHRRRLRFTHKWKIMDAFLGDRELFLQPVVRR